jgi:hypothetical protein
MTQPITLRALFLTVATLTTLAVLAVVAFPQPHVPTPLPVEPGEPLPDAPGVDGDPAAYDGR